MEREREKKRNGERIEIRERERQRQSETFYLSMFAQKSNTKHVPWNMAVAFL